MNLGQRIKEYRCRIGLSQREVARRSGITVSFISQVERGVACPSLKSLVNIAMAIGARISYLLEEDDSDFYKIEIIKMDTRERMILKKGDSINLDII